MPYINKLDGYNKMSLADLKKKYLEHTDVIHQLLQDISTLVELKRAVCKDQDELVFKELGFICKRWKCNNPYPNKELWGKGFIKSEKKYRAGYVDLVITELKDKFEEHANKVNKIFSFMVHTNKLHALHSFEFIVSKYPDSD